MWYRRKGQVPGLAKLCCVMHGARTPRNKDQNQLIKALRYHSVEYILGRSVSCYPKGLGALNSRTEIIFGNDKATSKRERW